MLRLYSDAYMMLLKLVPNLSVIQQSNSRGRYCHTQGLKSSTDQRCNSCNFSLNFLEQPIIYSLLSFVHRVFPEQCRSVLPVWLQQWQLPSPQLNEWVATATPSEHAAFGPRTARVSACSELNLRWSCHCEEHDVAHKISLEIIFVSPHRDI